MINLFYMNGKKLFQGEALLKFNEFVTYFGLKRSFRFVNGCVVLEPFMQMWVRSLFVMLFAVGMTFLLLSGALGTGKGSIIDELRWYYDFDDRAYEAYIQYKKNYDPKNELHREMFEDTKSYWKTHSHLPSEIAPLLIATIPLLISLFRRREALVVFDKKRRLIYTVKDGKVYYHKVYDLNYLPFSTNTGAISASSLIIPLNVDLYQWQNKKCLMHTEVFSTGIFYPDSNCQQQFLCILLNAYFSNQNKDTDDAWLTSILTTGPSKKFLEFLDKIVLFSFRKREDPFSPEVQAVVDQIMVEFKDLEEGDMDFEDFDFSYRKPLVTQ
ncbi:hypothetical protein Q4490_06605 [Neptunomonas phycophila]|uniref:Uncharacterized protein n=1 Tax=Neptunomonas phycophila TaxID=1572645 RepID=A0AAW7XG92_9GAMM|nr:hypothetical protein [Neptunomonas phycophila]MDO6453231.1 hypothetical protein [Neptunomonas phycophila]